MDQEQGSRRSPDALAVQTMVTERTVSGTEIRETMATGDDTWRASVPDATRRVIDDTKGVARMQSLWTE